MKADNTYYIQGILNNDKKIFEEINRICFPKVRAFVLRYKGNIQDAEDAFYKGFETVYKKLLADDLMLKGHFLDFLVGVCKNKWRNEGRKSARSELMIPDDNTLIDSSNIVNTLIEEEQRLLYRKKLNELSEACKKLLNLFFIEGLSYKEIAVQLNYSNAQTATVQSHKCKKQLIKKIQNDPLFKELI